MNCEADGSVVDGSIADGAADGTLNEKGDIAFQVNSPNLKYFTRYVGANKYGPRGETPLLDESLRELYTLLGEMWAESPELCIKNIFHKGDCRGGEKEKFVFQSSVRWLLTWKITRYANLSHIPEYRCWKDLLKLLYLNCDVDADITDLFVQQLKLDLSNMEKKERISLCAKWVPSEGSAFDREHPDFLQNLRKSLDCTTAREFRQKVLSPLRKYLKIVELSMCAQQWEQINYSTVPSVAMQRYRRAFAEHDAERFATWKAGLKTGVTKVNTAQLFPHDILKDYLNDGPLDEVTEAQFSAMVESVKKSGSFGKCLVIVDTSGSMAGTPMAVAVSLGLLISRCVSGPFANVLINFSESPVLTQLEGKSVHQDVHAVRNMQWGGSTNLDKVFDLLLEKARTEHISVNDMPTHLFILTDMQFDRVHCPYSMTNNSQSALDRARTHFTSAERPFPLIVCWNLRGDVTTSAASDNSPGVCTVTGFSADILSMIMKGKIPSPYGVMLEVLRSERYAPLDFPGKTERL